MSERVAVPTLEVDYGEVDPLTAYAKLRSFTPGRASFLFESHAPDRPGGRYSLLGYRVATGELYPPAVDAIGVVLDYAAQAASPPTLAEAVAQAAVGYLSYENAHTIHGIPPREGGAAAGSFVRGAVIVLFDHQARRASIATSRPGNLAERCQWELRHGPDLDELGVVAPDALPAQWSALPEPDQLAARAARAMRFLSEPDAELVLAQTFHVPARGVDPFDVYCALRQLGEAPLSFFVDLGESPMAPRTCLLGSSDTVLCAELPGPAPSPGVESLRETLRAGFPHPSVTGSAPLEAAQIIRRVEDAPRDVLGAAVGFACPGPGAWFVLAERAVLWHGAAFELPVPVTVTADGEPERLAQIGRQKAQPGLAAIFAAQRAAAARADGGSAGTLTGDAKGKP